MLKDTFFSICLVVGCAAMAGALVLLAAVIWFKILNMLSTWFRLHRAIWTVVRSRMKGKEPAWIDESVAADMDQLRKELDQAERQALKDDLDFVRWKARVRAAAEWLQSEAARRGDLAAASRALDDALACRPTAEQVDAAEDGKDQDAARDQHGG